MINVNTPVFLGNEKEYLNNCIETGYLSSFGSYVDEFEAKFSDYIGVKHSTTVTNGTVALDLVFEVLDLKEGDEVILPTGTIVSCLLPLLRRKIKPIFVDSNIKTWNSDIDDVIDKITIKTKAILVVHLYGLSFNVKKLKDYLISNSIDIKIIEDCAEGLGGKINDKMLGSYGDLSTFSFYANKLITTGEGGMVCSNSLELIEKVKYFKNLCFQQPRFYHENLGWNSRFTNIQAAIGLAQLENINQHLNIKKRIGKLYSNLLSEFSDYFYLPLKHLNGSENVYWVYGMVVKNSTIDPTKLTKSLLKKGIETRPFFYPLHNQPFLKNVLSLPNAEYLGKNGFYLPSGLGLKESEIKYVVDCLRKII